MRAIVSMLGVLLVSGVGYAKSAPSVITLAQLQAAQQQTFRPTVSARTLKTPTGWSLFKQSTTGDLGVGKWEKPRATKTGDSYRLVTNGVYLLEGAKGTTPVNFLTQ